MTKKKDKKPKPGANNKVDEKDESPEFKPGKKPYTQFGALVLNANVPWDELVTELNECGVDCESIATEIKVETQVVENLLKRKTKGLTFRAGASLITIHCRYFPEDYE